MEYLHERIHPCIERTVGARSEYGPLSLHPDDRPRERLIRLGHESLSDEELLSIILVSGIRGRNVTQIARELLKKLDKEKNIPSIKELCSLGGMGEPKACTIAAMLEFGRRKWAGGQKIQGPEDIFHAVRHYAERRQERFICLSLNGAHELIAKRVITVGLVNQTIVHPREVFADPIVDRASAVIAAHNHPSGRLDPSEEDIEITQRLEATAKILGIDFLDHLIFSQKAYFSFRHAGIIQGTGNASYSY